MIENPMKGKRGHVCGIPLVCPLVSPGFTKQTGNGRVRLSLVRPSSSRTPCARTYVCAANMRMRRGRYASSRERCLRTYACMSMRWQNTRGGDMCRQCRASGVRPRQPGLFQVQVQVQVQGHVHTEESRWALLNARSCPHYLTPLFW